MSAIRVRVSLTLDELALLHDCAHICANKVGDRWNATDQAERWQIAGRFAERTRNKLWALRNKLGEKCKANGGTIE